jgi:AMMECR1 domain-containing protein
MNIEKKLILNIFNRDKSTRKYLRGIPDKCFGVFVTVRRGQKLKTWPIDIHGCIGYWNPNYKILEKEEIYDRLLSVGKSAMFDDKRREYFLAIETDKKALVEIDFMMTPLYNIDAQTGMIQGLNIPFDNNKFGLIVDGPSRATYLPKVFPKISWSKIKYELLTKAGIAQLNDSSIIKFYAYEIKQKKIKITDVFNSTNS